MDFEGRVKPLFFYMISKEEIEIFLNKQLEGTQHFLVEVDFHGDDHVIIYIDSYDKFTHNDCIQVTKELQQEFGSSLDDLTITVSSAGLDRPLRLSQQYYKNIGKRVRVVCFDGRVYEGVLVNLDAEKITLRPQIPFHKGKQIVYKDLPFIDIDFHSIKQTTRIINNNF